jgi:23S rRNA U2552 (ribose-2'-O)-methylase RlmE/FtsJ
MRNAVNSALKRLGFQTGPAVTTALPEADLNPLSKAQKILDPGLLQWVDWKHQDLDLSRLQNSRYYNIWKKFEGGHKKYSYFELYDRLFTEFSEKQPKVLEIGVYKGASIQAWKEFFGEGSTIVGIDINPECARFDSNENGVHVRIGDQSDIQFLKQLRDEFGSFDIIMDDGSHLTHHIIATFNYAFLHCLADGGIYFIEDLNTSYWKDYRTSEFSAMDMVLSLCEMTHQFYVEHTYHDYMLDSGVHHYPTPLINTILSEVRVFDSAAAIYRKSHYPPLVFHT